MKETQMKKNYENPLATERVDPLKKGHELKHKVFSFLIGAMEYAFEAQDAPEIVKAVPVTEVPSTPAFIKGIIPFRGEMLAVIDLRNRLGMEGQAKNHASKHPKMLIAGSDDQRAAFLVDAAYGICEAIAHPPDAPEENAIFVKWIIKSQGRVIRVLSLEKLLNISINTPHPALGTALLG